MDRLFQLHLKLDAIDLDFCDIAFHFNDFYIVIYTLYFILIFVHDFLCCY